MDSKQKKIIVIVAGAAVLTVVVLAVGGLLGGTSGGRSSAYDAVRAAASTDDLIREREGIVSMLNRSHDSPNAKPERVKMMKDNLKTIEDKLAAEGIDITALEPQPEWDS